MAAIETIARLTITLASGAPQPGGLLRSNPEFDLRLEAQAQTANGAGSNEMQARLQKEIVSLEKVIDSSERQLADATFLSKAPDKIVNGMRAKLVDYRAQLKKNRELLEGL
jgi:valyl-tRNA synthetase